MFLARVIGTVVASVKYPGLEGAKLLVVQPIDSAGEASGAPLVACDVGQAGPGDRVACVTSREATHVMPDTFVPVDVAVVGIVDAVDRPRAGAPS